jgi:tRNA pseudouridine13 synthase
MKDFEKDIGIEVFFTKEKGIGGKLRTLPEDFIVKEVFLKPRVKEEGRFIIAEVYCKNWETHRLVNELSKRLRISRKRIGFAGTKDKRACTTRLMSFYNVSKEELSLLNIKDVNINILHSSDKPIKIGDLKGNIFEIKVRNIEDRVDRIKNIISHIEDYQGFPNFYGIQRFGVMRPINHVVGRHIIRGNFEKAVMSYIANPIKGEDENTFNLRAELQKSYDFLKALSNYPPSLGFEKAVLNRLVINPKDFVYALKALPKNLLTMFVNAYQSFLFNRILSERIRRGLPLKEAILGDIILSKEEKAIFVDRYNIDKVNRQISKGKAFVSGLIIGSNPLFSRGEMGEIEHKIVEEERVDFRDFTVPEIPFLSSSGSRRMLLAPLSKIEWRLGKDELNPGKKYLNLRFELRKGCYATSLLRELMKSENARDY